MFSGVSVVGVLVYWVVLGVVFCVVVCYCLRIYSCVVLKVLYWFMLLFLKFCLN